VILYSYFAQLYLQFGECCVELKILKQWLLKTAADIETSSYALWPSQGATLDIRNRTRNFINVSKIIIRNNLSKSYWLLFFSLSPPLWPLCLSLYLLSLFRSWTRLESFVIRTSELCSGKPECLKTKRTSETSRNQTWPDRWGILRRVSSATGSFFLPAESQMALQWDA